MNRAVIIAGTHSGSGKTTVTLGIMAALANRGRKVQPFKCGPDFIDPTLHRLVSGRVSKNLDGWMAGEAFSRSTFTLHTAAADISVIEGVMGMYDGGDSSSAALAQQLKVPQLLVVDVSSAAESVAAVVKGFEDLNPEAMLQGVILNRIASPRHLQLVSDAIHKHCRAEIIGSLPRDLAFTIPERHLGLHMGEESPLSRENINKLAEAIEAHVDLDRLLSMAVLSDHDQPADLPAPPRPVVRLAVARDQAFCFYYEDNFDLLRRAGAELVFFSPLSDRALPPDCDAIYLGGGYPELHAAQLCKNSEMRTAIKEWADKGGIIYAECGGFMYLCQSLLDHHGASHSMCGVFPFATKMEKRRASLGYREVQLKADSLFGPAGTLLRGHEFHYSTLDLSEHSPDTLYTIAGRDEEGYRVKNVIGSYIHLHFGSTPDAVTSMINRIQHSSPSSGGTP